jgi:hypothetical protein
MIEPVIKSSFDRFLQKLAWLDRDRYRVCDPSRMSGAAILASTAQCFLSASAG